MMIRVLIAEGKTLPSTQSKPKAFLLRHAFGNFLYRNIQLCNISWIFSKRQSGIVACTKRSNEVNLVESQSGNFHLPLFSGNSTVYVILAPDLNEVTKIPSPANSGMSSNALITDDDEAFGYKNNDKREMANIFQNKG